VRSAEREMGAGAALLGKPSRLHRAEAWLNPSLPLGAEREGAKQG